MSAEEKPQNHEDGDIICERVIEHEIVIPKRVVREEIIEKVVIIPETIVREEIIDEVQKIRETIIEIAKPVYQEKIVEVPQIDYREKIVEKVEKIYEKKTVKVPKIEYRERLVEVPKYIDPEGNVIDPPETEIHETIVERIVEVPEIQEEVIVREVAVPKYIEKVLTPDKSTQIKIPVPIEAVTTYDYQLKHPTPVLNEVAYPLYAPTFIEVPISAQLFDSNQLAEMASTQARLQEIVNAKEGVPLPQLEQFATEVRQQKFLTEQASPEVFKQNIIEAWKTGQVNMVTRQELVQE